MKKSILPILLVYLMQLQSCSLGEIHSNILPSLPFEIATQQQENTSLLSVQAVAEANDNGFIVVGYRHFDAFGTYGYWHKMNREGKVINTLDIGIFHGISVESDVYDIVPLGEDGYALCGSNKSLDNDDRYLSVNFLAEDGTWKESYQHPEPSEGKQLVLTEDGGVIVAGNSGQNSALFKVSKNGELEWEKKFDNTVALTEDIDNTYAVMINDNFGPGDSRLLRIKSDGNVVTDVNFSGFFSSDRIVFTRLNSGEYACILVFLTSIDVRSSVHFFDESGTETRNTVNFPNIWLRSIQATEDGGFLVCGSTQRTNRSNAFMQKQKADGSLEWSNLYGGELDDYGQDAIQLKDGSYFMGGIDRSISTSDNLPGNVGIYLVKTDRNGNLE